jgi:hypothetical protein
VISVSQKHRILFDDSAVNPSLSFLRDPSHTNLKGVVSALGNRLVFRHYQWSSMDSKTTENRFWKKQLARVSWTQEFEDNIWAVRKFLLEQEEASYLGEVLRYLPKGHSFNTIVYLVVGYDNIVFGEDVALNLSFWQFHADKRESVYYLIHELAHAGYFKYHDMPQLREMRSINDLLRVIRVLTHLEGMGVISAFRKRTVDNGFLDRDYQVLMNDAERKRRVEEYFRALTKLERNSRRMLKTQHLTVFNKMSGRKTRLWYITGCHMAQQIERSYGIETLRKLIIKGAEEFFRSYNKIKNHV